MEFTKEQILDTKEKLQKFDVEWSRINPKLITFDTETNGVDIYKDVIIGFSISINPDSGIYVPLLEWVPNLDSFKNSKYSEGKFKCIWDGKTYKETVTSEEYKAPNFIIDYLKKWLNTSRFVAHNAPFDCNMVAYNFNLEIESRLFADTILLKHLIDENSSHGLKETAIAWAEHLGFDEDQIVNQEQLELGQSVIKNGGRWTTHKKHVWRGDVNVVAKYAIMDTVLTYRLFNYCDSYIKENFTPEQYDWIYKDEVIPLCRDIMVPLARKGVFTDVDHFKQLAEDAQDALNRCEDEIQKMIKPLLVDFKIAKSVDEVVKPKHLIEYIIRDKSLPYPTLNGKPSLSKKAIEAQRKITPHWLWDYCLGEDVFRVKGEQLQRIKYEIYIEKIGRRYPFNINSNAHLKWLIFEKLGENATLFPKSKGSKNNEHEPSLEAAALKHLLLDKYEWVRPLISYKKIKKLASTYIRGVLRLNNHGWLHVGLKQHGTTSGRLAGTNGFNLQNLPRATPVGICPKCSSKNTKINKTNLLIYDIDCLDCKFTGRDIPDVGSIKAGIIAPPGYKIVSADFASLEPRIFSHMSNDDKLKEVYYKGLDLYSKVYCDVLDKSGKYSADPKDDNYLKKLAPEERDRIKPATLAPPYGAGAGQCAKILKLFTTKDVWDKDSKSYVSKEVADYEAGQKFIDDYLSAYPNLKKYMEQCETSALQKGYVESKLGRRRHLPRCGIIQKYISAAKMTKDKFLNLPFKKIQDTNVSNTYLNSDLLFKLCKALDLNWYSVADRGGWGFIRFIYKEELNNSKNYPIQSFAAHITNKAMLEINQEFKNKDIDGYIFLQVHDEIAAYVKEDQTEEAAAIFKDKMEHNAYSQLIDVPTPPGDVAVCDSLKEAK